MSRSEEFHFREATRAPLAVPVKLQFDKFGRFVGTTANLSEGGMYVRDNQPKPVGTYVRFELELRDGLEPVQGLGEVVWIRVRLTEPGQDPGMGIQFLTLDFRSRERVRLAVEAFVRAYGLPPEPEPPEALGLRSKAAERRAASRFRRKRSRPGLRSGGARSRGGERQATGGGEAPVSRSGLRLILALGGLGALLFLLSLWLAS